MEKLNMKMDNKENGEYTYREVGEEFGEESRKDSLFRFMGRLEEETPRKRFKRFEGGTGEGTEAFSYGVGSIVDTVELRDYTCILGCRAREHSDELIRLILAMRTEKASMTKAREEAFRKVRTDLMGVVDELVYAQMMMQGRLIEARHQRPMETCSRIIGHRTPDAGVPLTAGTPAGENHFGKKVDEIISELHVGGEANKAKIGEPKLKKKGKDKAKSSVVEEKKKVKKGPERNDPEPKAGPSKEVKISRKDPEAVSKRKKGKTPKSVPTEKPKAKAEAKVAKAAGALPGLKPMTVTGKADGWTTVRSNGKRKEKRVVPREVRILLEEIQKSHGKKYGGYILKEKNWGRIR